MSLTTPPYTCNENAEVGVGGTAVPLTSDLKVPNILGAFLKHSLGGDTLGTREKGFILQ